MAQQNYSTELGEMVEVFSGAENPLVQMMGWLCQELMEAEVSGRIGAEKHERGRAKRIPERVSTEAIRHAAGEHAAGSAEAAEGWICTVFRGALPAQ